MTCQGERSRPITSENGRILRVSTVRSGPEAQVGDVLWGAVATGSDRTVGACVVAAAAEVVHAVDDDAQREAGFPARDPLPERSCVTVLHEDRSNASRPGRHAPAGPHCGGPVPSRWLKRMPSKLGGLVAPWARSAGCATEDRLDQNSVTTLTKLAPGLHWQRNPLPPVGGPTALRALLPPSPSGA